MRSRLVRIMLAIALALAATAGCAELIGADFAGATLASDATPEDATGPDIIAIEGPDAEADVTFVDAAEDVAPPFDAHAASDAELALWLTAELGVADGGVPGAPPSPDAGEPTLVTSWADQSGNDRNVVVMADAGAPLLRPNAHNGLPVIAFQKARSTCFASPAWGGPPGDAGVTLFVVAAGTPTSLLRFQGPLTTDWLIFPWDYSVSHLAPDPDPVLYVRTATDVQRIRSPFDPEMSLATARLSPGIVGGMEVFKNGALVERSSLRGTAMPMTDVLTLGCSYALTEFAEADVAEILVYGGALEEHERLAVERYLSDKWALTLPR